MAVMLAAGWWGTRANPDGCAQGSDFSLRSLVGSAKERPLPWPALGYQQDAPIRRALHPSRRWFRFCWYQLWLQQGLRCCSCICKGWEHRLVPRYGRWQEWFERCSHSSNEAHRDCLLLNFCWCQRMFYSLTLVKCTFFIFRTRCRMLLR